jgi:hypothetical protein
MISSIVLLSVMAASPAAPLPPQAPPTRVCRTERPARPTKTCSCSGACACGCNEGAHCECGPNWEVRKASSQPINPYYGTPYVAPPAGIPGGARFAPPVVTIPRGRWSSGGSCAGGS